MSQPSNSNPPPSSGSTRPPLKQQLNQHHPLVKLSQALDWSYFEQEFGKVATAQGGRSASLRPELRPRGSAEPSSELADSIDGGAALFESAV